MTDTSPAPVEGGIDRRRLLKIGAWAAPAILVAAAVPAASASDPTQNQFPTPTSTGTIRDDALSGRLAVWNLNSGGTPGPIGWNGQIGYWSNILDSDPNTGTLAYVVAVLAPGTTQWQTIKLDVAALVKYGSLDLPNAEWGTDVMATGTYTFRLAVVGSDGLRILAEQTLVL